MLRRLVSGWIWFSTALVALLWLPWLALVFIVTAPFDPGRYVVGRWFRRAAVVAVALNPLWRFRTSGVRIDDPRRPYVAVSNHESIADIFLISHLPWEMKWLSKDANFRIPVLGWMMQMAGDVRLVRSERASRRAALEQCRDRLDRRVSVMIFPEGTRSPTGEMLPFKDGAFRLAIETGTPILPLVVAGTRDCMQKGSGIFNRAHAEVRALEPISTTGLGPDEVPVLRDRVRDLIARERDRLFAELGASSPGLDTRHA
jgi:1-acyl-sn-glycerol-3-phosphate acyltransferase